MNTYNDMMLEIEKQARLLEIWEWLKGYTLELCTEMKLKGKEKKIFIVGCGDSFFAGLAAREFFVKYTKNICLPMSSLEFAKYGIDEVDSESTVIAISMSGNVARTIESIEEAQGKDAFVIGITNSKKGDLYKKANCPILLGVEEEAGWTPGTLTYEGTLLAIYAIAIGLSEKVVELYSDMENTLRNIEKLINFVKPVSEDIGKNLVYNRNEMPIYVIGAGPSFATAKYSAAKFLEICDCVAIGQESEELAHQEFWIINKNNPVFVLAPKDAGFDRTQEISECLRKFGNDLYVISSDQHLCELGKYGIMIEDISNDFSPFIYDIPMQLIAYYFSKAKGLDPDRRTHNDPFRKKISRLMTRGRVCEC